MKTAATLQRPKRMSNTAKPVMLPYGRQTIVDDDIRAVEEVLRSDWLTQGPTIERFESALAEVVGARCAVACANGTAALHLAMLALRLGPGDIAVTTPNTFVADANCGRYVGADVRFVDIDPGTGNMSPDSLASALADDTGKRIKVVVVVHFAGQPADMLRISQLARAHGAFVVEDACHALGARYDADGTEIRVGSCRHSDLTVFSFHPVKHVATGEGGALSTNSPELETRLKLSRSHGIARDNFECREMALDTIGTTNLWYYEMQELGFNYRLTDIQAALGLSQMKRLRHSLDRRNDLARLYGELLSERFADGEVRPLALRDDCYHAYHLYVVQVDFERLRIRRNALVERLRECGIGTQVHYIPIHLQPYYRTRYGHTLGDFPNAERYYSKALSLPMYPALTDNDIERVADELTDAIVICRENR